MLVVFVTWVSSFIFCLQYVYIGLIDISFRHLYVAILLFYNICNYSSVSRSLNFNYKLDLVFFLFLIFHLNLCELVGRESERNYRD